MKVYIAIPSCRDWKPQFGASICGLVRKMTIDNIDFEMNVMIGTSVLPKARQMAMEHAIQLGFTHILFLDDDMLFNTDLFNKLSEPDLAVVAANYSNKNPEGTLPQSHRLDGSSFSSKGKEGMEEAGWVGFGAILIDLSIMSNVPKPWFEMRWITDRNSFIGEDYFFCAQVRNHGHKIYLNHDVKCGHIGDFAYREAL